MFAPLKYTEKSLYDESVQIRGNETQISEIKELANNNIKEKIDLYAAMTSIKQYLAQKYGEDWLHKSEEAIEFIVENEYCNDERKQNPMISLEYKKYIKDLRKGIMY